MGMHGLNCKHREENNLQTRPWARTSAIDTKLLIKRVMQTAA